MKLIRKALLPAIVAAGFLGFLGTAGAASPDVTIEFDAGDGDVCSITGPLFIEEGETVEYLAIVQNPFDALNGNGGNAEIDVDLNDFDGGDSDITSIDRDGDGDTESITDTDFLNDEDLQISANTCGDDADDLLADLVDDIFDFLIEGEEDGEICAAGLVAGDATDCQASSPPDGVEILGHNGINDDDIDCGYVAIVSGDQQCFISPAALEEIAELLADMLSGNCLDDLSETDLVALTVEGITEFVSLQIEDYIDDNGFLVCVSDEGAEGEILVDVTCDDPGVFDLSFAPQDGGAASIEVVCGSDVETGTITAIPTTVEINPSLANVAHSLVFVSLLGDNNEIAFPGTEVMWTTDRCAIEASTVDTEDEFEAAENLFRANNALNPATAAAIESSVYATTAPDGASRQQEEVNTFGVTGSAAGGFVERTISAVILHCDPIHAPGVTPGPAVVTAFVERGDSDIDDDDLDNDLSDNDDLVLRTTVTVVGPPAANGVTVTAAPSTLACGEKATITVDVKDSIGQPVSDHTWVEAVTNAGGVLAGTGAVAGQAGLVSPISSTVAETFGGKATLYLLTSTAHVGKYEVVITTGGGGGVTGQLASGGVTTNLLGGLFTTAPISVQVTVECTVPSLVQQGQAPAPAPTTTGPRTGQGITPPSTGDAGMASSDNSSLILVAIAGAVALVAASFALKVVREEN